MNHSLKPLHNILAPLAFLNLDRPLSAVELDRAADVVSMLLKVDFESRECIGQLKMMGHTEDLPEPDDTYTHDLRMIEKALKLIDSGSGRVRSVQERNSALVVAQAMFAIRNSINATHGEGTVMFGGEL